MNWVLGRSLDAADDDELVDLAAGCLMLLNCSDVQGNVHELERVHARLRACLDEISLRCRQRRLF